MARHLAIIGSGAVAGVLAEAAHAAGHTITLCVRTPVSEFTVDTPDGTRSIPVSVVTSPDKLSTADLDWAVLTTKIQDVPSAAHWFEHLAPTVGTMIVQNGVEHAESARVAGVRGPWLPALIYVSAERVARGQLVRRSPVGLTVPDEDLSTAIPELFTDADFGVHPTPDFRTEAWRKMLTNVVSNPITALTHRRLDVLGEPDILELARAVLRETVAVAQAEGAALTEDDVQRLLAFAETWPADGGTSMLYDRLAGLGTEHEHITGPVVAGGQRHGIPTPLNTALLALLRALRPAT